jgi:rhamnose transport system permease protein
MIIIIAKGDQVNASEMGVEFQAFPKDMFFGLTSPVWIAIGVSILFWVFLNLTRAGRGLYAVGGNPVAARYCGIDQRRQELLAYAISGAVAGLCGYLWVARYGVAYSEIANGYELTVIAACVIGGVSIGGGVGSVAGTLLGALFLGIVMTALPVLQISPFWQMAISGAVILAAVVINARAERRPEKLILPEARRIGRVRA